MLIRRETATGEFVVEQVEQVEQDTNVDNEDKSETEGEEELEDYDIDDVWVEVTKKEHHTSYILVTY